MRVCFISHLAEMGGAELALMEAIEGLMARGVECRVVVPRPGCLVAECDSHLVECYVCNFTWWVGWQSPRGFKNLMKMVWRLWRQLAKGREIAGLLSSWKPHVVVTNTVCMAVGAFAARKLGSAHVWYIHEFGFLDHGLRFLLGRRLSLWVMNRYSAAVICNSQAVAQHFSDGIPAAKRRIIPPIRGKPSAKLAEEAAVAERSCNRSLNCVMVGRVAPQKRQEDAVAAVGQLARAGLDVRLSIVGNEVPRYRELLDRLIDEYDIRDRVEFVTWVRDPSPYVRAADVVLMCSQMEAFGRVTVEAMQLGRPVIGARSGGTTELVRDGQTGLLFEVGDPTDLAQKIRHLYEQRDLVGKFGAAARMWTDEAFSEEATTGKIYELLCKCAGKRPRNHDGPESARLQSSRSTASLGEADYVAKPVD